MTGGEVETETGEAQAQLNSDQKGSTELRAKGTGGWGAGNDDDWPSGGYG